MPRTLNPLDVNRLHGCICGVGEVAGTLDELLDRLPTSFAEKHREVIIAKIRHLEYIEDTLRKVHKAVEAAEGKGG